MAKFCNYECTAYKPYTMATETACFPQPTWERPAYPSIHLQPSTADIWTWPMDLLFFKHCEIPITGHSRDVRSRCWIHILGSMVGEKEINITFIRRERQEKWGKVYQETKARDVGKGTVSLMWNQNCREQLSARRGGSAGSLSSSHCDVFIYLFIYLFLVQVPKWISKLIMKFEIPHWDTKNCWGKSTFLSVTTRSARACTNILLSPGCAWHCLKNRAICLASTLRKN